METGLLHSNLCCLALKCSVCIWRSLAGTVAVDVEGIITSQTDVASTSQAAHVGPLPGQQMPLHIQSCHRFIMPPVWPHIKLWLSSWVLTTFTHVISITSKVWGEEQEHSLLVLSPPTICSSALLWLAPSTVTVSCIVYIYCVLQNSSVWGKKGCFLLVSLPNFWCGWRKCHVLPSPSSIWYTDSSRLDILVIFTVSQTTGWWLEERKVSSTSVMVICYSSAGKTAKWVIKMAMDSTAIPFGL